MSAASDADFGPLRLRLHWRGLTGSAIGDWTIAVLVFLSGFVMFEPAPFDLLLCAVFVVWAFFGIRLNRHFLSMTILLMLYCVGGILGLTQVDTFIQPFIYIATTIFLAMSSIFFAAVIVEAPERRLKLVANAYIAIAVVVSLIGTLAYLNAIPGAEMFKLYSRARGTFQDPNVYAPFLLLPLLLLCRTILTSRLRDSLWQIVFFIIILLGIFLSFSRAAWGVSIVTLAIVAFLAFLNERSALVRFRLVAYVVTGAMAVGMMLAAVVSIPAVNALFTQRAAIVQDYDEGPMGRFDRHIIGFQMAQEKPLGLGPFTFGLTMKGDEHNMWLKGFTVYGWLGGISYIVLVLWTLAAATPLLFKPRPWQGIVQCTYAAFVGHLIIHNVIDNDHWRHVFLIYGILWGAIAAEKMHRHSLYRAGLRPYPVA